MSPVETHTLVIGAGPAGLAAGACLKKLETSFIILEKAGNVGSVWRRHYDRLHLHSDKGHSELPHLPFPKHYPRYISRQQLVDYLDAYEKHFELKPQFGQDVNSVKRVQDTWVTQTSETEYESKNVIVATGYTREPVIPKWQGMETFKGTIIHSSKYKNAEPFKGKKMLVVGFGNSGGEIAIDLCENDCETHISVRSPVNIIPKELFGLPILSITPIAVKFPAPVTDAFMKFVVRLMYGNIKKYGLRKQAYGPLTQVLQDAQIPLLDIGTMGYIKQGKIKVKPGIVTFSGNEIQFVNSPKEHYDAIVLATGYRPKVNEFLKETSVMDHEGTPHESGKEVAPGLYFCGFYVSPIGGLNVIAQEAEDIAKSISTKNR